MPSFTKTNAFVLKASKYSETSLIVTLFTLEEGKVRCIAKGARRPKNPLAGKLEPLNELEIIYIRGKSELFTVKECSMIKSRPALREDFDRINAALRIMALLDETQAIGDAHSEIFELVRKTLDAIENCQNLPSILLFYRTRLLAASGYSPDFNNCARCNLQLRKTAFYDDKLNGFICPNCRKGKQGRSISSGAMQILRHFQTATLETGMRTKMSEPQREEMDRLFKRIFEAIFEKRSTACRILDGMQAKLM